MKVFAALAFLMPLAAFAQDGTEPKPGNACNVLLSTRCFNGRDNIPPQVVECLPNGNDLVWGTIFDCSGGSCRDTGGDTIPSCVFPNEGKMRRRSA